MGRIEIGFQYPWFLLLLSLIPLVWWLGPLWGRHPRVRSLGGEVFRHTTLRFLAFGIRLALGPMFRVLPEVLDLREADGPMGCSIEMLLTKYRNVPMARALRF